MVSVFQDAVRAEGTKLPDTGHDSQRPEAVGTVNGAATLCNAVNTCILHSEPC